VSTKVEYDPPRNASRVERARIGGSSSFGRATERIFPTFQFRSNEAVGSKATSSAIDDLCEIRRRGLQFDANT